MAKQKLNINIKSLKEGKPAGAGLNGTRIAIVLVSGKVYAIDAVCTHRGGPLDKGTVKDSVLTCPWHGGKFDVTAGKAEKSTPWVHDTKSYKIIAEKDGELFVEL